MNEIDEVDARVKQHECVCSVANIRCWHMNTHWSWPADNRVEIPWMGGRGAKQPMVQLKPMVSICPEWEWRADPDYTEAAVSHYRDSYGVTEFITDGSYPF